MYLTPEVYGEFSIAPKLYSDVGQIYRNSQHLRAMIDDILDLANFEMTGFTLRKEPTDLDLLVRDVGRVAIDLFRGKEIDLQFELEASLPVVEVDATRIRQVVLNLLNNAYRFTEKGVVTVRTRTVPNWFICEVEDSGPGVPPELQERLFEEFYQVDFSLSRSFGGAGLGLAICKRFVEAHDGKIWVENTAGRGATFVFKLPFGADLDEAKIGFKPRFLEPQSPLLSPRLLVLDSDPVVVSLFDRHLSGYEVLQVEHERYLMEAIVEHRPVAILWNTLPGQGLDKGSFQEIEIPIISFSLPSQSWMASELGVIAALSKPLEFDHLYAELAPLGVLRDIIVVDDNEGISQLVERGLSPVYPDLIVRQAYDGRHGLNLMRQKTPELVILDLVMPEVDGFQVMEEMKGDPILKEVPLILLTATNYGRDLIALKAGQFLLHRNRAWGSREILQLIEGILDNIEHALPAYS